MNKSVFTTTEIASITGFTKRQLDYWAREHIVVPSAQQATGSGSRRFYNIEDLVILNFVSQLKKRKLSTQKIRKAIATLQDVMDDPQPMRTAILLHSEKTVLALCKTREGERILFDALNSGRQQAMSIVLETLVNETQGIVSAYAPDLELLHVKAAK